MSSERFAGTSVEVRDDADTKGTTRYAALLATMQRLVREPDAERAFAEDPRGFLANSGLGSADVEQLASLGARRLFLYRRHVRKTLGRGIRKQIPRTAARLGDAFQTWVDRFIEAEAPRSQYFRDAAFEMVAWAAPRWIEDASVLAYLGDLARHELSQFEAATAPPDPLESAPAAEITLDRGVRFAGSVRLARYDHAIHQLDADEAARDVPERVPTALLIYRDEEHDPRLLSLTPLAAAIVERLLAGEALGAAVVGAAAALHHAVDDAVTQSTAALLEDLRARGALLGGAP
ncbi:Hypothetical protein A7982_05713 [Minicystis rosea]|nr:Hypothetical protein A7982_05713 [Minicystis rosea]